MKELLCSRSASMEKECLVILAFLMDYSQSYPISNFKELLMERGEFPTKFTYFPQAEETSQPNERLVKAGWVEELGETFPEQR